MKLEANSTDLGQARKIGRLQRDFVSARLAIGLRQPLDPSPDDGFHKGGARQLGSLHARNRQPVAKHCRRIAKPKYLVETMRDIENGDSRSRQISYDR